MATVPRKLVKPVPDNKTSLVTAGLGAVDTVLGSSRDSVVRSEEFAVAVALASRVRTGVAARAQHLSRKLWHTLNLPAATDVNRLLTQIGAVERQVRELSNALSDAQTREG
ncbi:hypothetical protein EFK50_14035 [Nocardioides marmoriginsengisoli]|uniref:Uncharacterized protein n=1 Tax=Nocardioides marmoriginsengisoli TaxID=661483 RepID=A0A3N0CHS2_9ACTN|nr:hypothetical protein [Nocardioides marmoriginsengisoli]RNL62849.1 hypothetical protein EFK50_14035 [Nocardioides marmoriginsengisoli]